MARPKSTASDYGDYKSTRRQQSKQSYPTTRRLSLMNLTLRGMEADFGPEYADTFRRELRAA